MKIVQARSEAINNWVWSTFASTQIASQCTKPMSAYLCQPLVSRSLVVNAGAIVVQEAEFRVYATLASNTDPQHTAQQFTTLPSKPSQPCSALLAQHCSTPLKPSAQQLGCIIFTLLSSSSKSPTLWSSTVASMVHIPNEPLSNIPCLGP